MDFWTPQTLQINAGGNWIVHPSIPQVFSGVSIDSRSITPGHVFIALPGEHFDGHDFLTHVIEANASAIVVSKHPTEIELRSAIRKRCGILLVTDTLHTLQSLARTYREVLRASGTTVIGVTGSNGKTSTRNLIYNVLSSTFKGSQSPKSFNNHIGVPLTLLAARPTDRFVVMELGTNHRGEIAALGAIAQPDIAVITNIGTAHLGTIGSREAIAEEKASLLQALSPGGFALVPGDEPALKPYLSALPPSIHVDHFGIGNNNHYQLLDCSTTDTGLRFTARHIAAIENPGQCNTNTHNITPDSLETSIFQLPLLGKHNALNALPAIAIGLRLGIKPLKMTSALANLSGVSMRLEPVKYGPPDRPLLIINDTYNANPDSMRVAVTTLCELQPPQPHGRRIAILGDMLELGEEASRLHAQLGQDIVDQRNVLNLRHDLSISSENPRYTGIHHVVLIGSQSCFAAEAMLKHWPSDRVHVFPEWGDSVPLRVVTLLKPGDIVLLKASRGMRLERLLPAIQNAFPETI
jgi:UDP-N-acetylmuramoyl-tripeptide--D-alanyl-D-alanine ligase